MTDPVELFEQRKEFEAQCATIYNLQFGRAVIPLLYGVDHMDPKPLVFHQDIS